MICYCQYPRATTAPNTKEYYVTSTRRRLSIGLSVLAVTSTFLLAACSSTSTTAQSSKSDPTSVVTVWTDAVRQAGFEQFQKTHPSIKLKISTIPTSIFTKLQLFNRTGSGWPDVIFDGNTNDIATLAGKQLNYTQPLDGKLTAAEKSGFGASNNVCKVDGVLSCIRNDVAPTVLWYDASLIKQFGYEVPKTWEEYEALSEKVAKDHPGYVMGALGDVFTYYNDFQSVGCPIQNVTAANTVHIDLTESSCTRMATILDTMLKNGTLLRSGTFDPDTIATAKAGKILMMPGANWYGSAVFESKSLYSLPNGRLSAAPALALGSNKAYSGSAGGGIYVVSRHAKNMDGAVAVAKWMATNVDFQKTAPTYPAYAPAATEWSKAITASTFFASDPVPVLKAQTALVNPINNFATRYEPATAFTDVIVAAVRAKTSILSALPALQSRLIDSAKSQGYTVK